MSHEIIRSDFITLAYLWTLHQSLECPSSHWTVACTRAALAVTAPEKAARETGNGRANTKV